MTTSRAILLIACLLAIGCRCSPKEQPTNAPVPKQAEQPVEAVLSLLEPANGECHWNLVDLPSGLRRTIVSLKAECGMDSRVTWSQAAKKALIVLGKKDFWSVDLASMAATRLPTPPDGEIVRIRIDETGRPWALTAEWKLHPDKDGHLKYGGQTFDVSIEEDSGVIPFLAHVFSYESDGRWLAKETSLLEVIIPEAPSYDDLKLAAAFEGGATFEEPIPRGQVVDADLVKRIKVAGNGWDIEEGTVADGDWMALNVTPPAYYRTESMEGEYQTADLAFTIGGQLVPVARGGGSFDYDARGAYVLRASEKLGEPTVFDARTGKLVFTSPTAVGARFWDNGLRSSP